MSETRNWSETEIRELVTAVRTQKEGKQVVTWGAYAEKYGRSERGCQTTWQRYRNNPKFQPTKTPKK